MLDETQRRVASWGVTLVAMIIPDPVNLEVEDHYGCRAEYGQYSEYGPKYLSATTARLAREAGIPTVDLYESFASSNPIDLYLTEYTDNHWNARGQALAVKLVAERL